MWIAYLDEAGCTGGLPSTNSVIQPVFAQAAIFVPQERLAHVTAEYLAIKQRFFPGLSNGGKALDAVLAEVKGSRIRSHVCGGRKLRRHAFGFLDRTVELLVDSGVRFVGRIWVKGIGVTNDPRSLYTFSLQQICTHFQQFLEDRRSQGFLVADSRRKQDNSNATHSIFTQKFGVRGDNLARLLEAPTFGHSENHVGLQLADHVCSALLFPVACFVYRTGHLQNIHVRPEYEELRDRYGQKMRQLAYTYYCRNERLRKTKMAGGVTVSDGLGRQPSHLIYCK